MIRLALFVQAPAGKLLHYGIGCNWIAFRGIEVKRLALDMSVKVQGFVIKLITR